MDRELVPVAASAASPICWQHFKVNKMDNHSTPIADAPQLQLASKGCKQKG